MGKIAFVFSGQGDQHTGMGADLYENSAEFKGIFDTAEELRPGTISQCFEGDETALSMTVNTQPCLFVYESAAAALLNASGIRADMAAGFSLGELSALGHAGALGFKEMLGLVMKRAELMQQASEEVKTQMAAVLKLDNDTVRELCSAYDSVYPVNFNCPGQVTVSGDAVSMPDFMEKVKAAGGRAVPLKVSGAFHSPFMAKAAESFRKILGAESFGKLELPVYANLTARPYGGDIAAVLGEQMSSPVLWEDTVRAMIDAGADTFIEIGPGATLSGMIKRISKEVETYSISSMDNFEKINERFIG